MMRSVSAAPTRRVSSGDGPHAGECVESNFGQAEDRVLFGDDEIEGESGLHRAAEALAVNRAERDDRQVETLRIAVDEIDAGMRISQQRRRSCRRMAAAKVARSPPSENTPGRFAAMTR